MTLSSGSLIGLDWIDMQVNPTETSPSLSAQMAVLNSFFQGFILLGMYNFGWSVKLLLCGFIE